MAQAFKKSVHICLRALLTVSLFILVLIALIQITLIAGVSYFNSGKAHDEIHAYVNGLMKASGYIITFDTASYYPVRGLTIRNLKAFDQEGNFLTLDKASLSVNLSQLPFRYLDVTIDAGTLHLLRLPQKAPDLGTGTELTPFTLPDLFFHSARISKFSLNKLIVDQTIVGTELSFSPSFEAKIYLGQDIGFQAVVMPRSTTKLSNILLPDKIDLDGSFTPETLGFKIDRLMVSSPDYSLSGKGDGSLVQNGAINLRIEAAYPDLKALTQGHFESASLSVQASGTLKNPALKAKGALKIALLKERGLSDINLTIDSVDALNSQKADIRITSTYLDNPVELLATLENDSEVIRIEALKATAPEIEITGAAVVFRQTFLPEGTMHLSATDLSYYKDLLQIHLAGSLEAVVSFRAVERTLSTDIKAILTNGRYETLRVTRLDADASFPDIYSPWPQAVGAKITGLSLSDALSLKNADISLKQKISSIYALDINGAGMAVAPFSFKGSADVSNLSNTLPTAEKINLLVNLNKSSLLLKGNVAANTLDLNFTTRDFSGRDIPASLPEAIKDIRLSGDIRMTGILKAPVTVAKITAAGFDTGEYKGLLVSADATHDAGKANVLFKGQGVGIKALKADISIPLEFSLSPFAFAVDNQAVMKGDFLSELELGALSRLFLPATQSLTGDLTAAGKIAGSINKPDLNGTIILKNGAFTDQEQGIELAEMKADASFTKSLLTLRSMTATDNEEGRLNATGEISLTAASAGNITLSLKNFHLPKSDMANGRLDASLSLESLGGGFSAKGVIDIDEMNITIPETFMSTIPDLNIIKAQKESARSMSTALAIKINAPKQIFVRGWGLDAEFGGEIDISGDAAAPQFNGTLSSKRGRFEEFGKRFTLARADLRFQGDVPPSPYLDIEATTPSGDIVASVLLTGPVKKPLISFSSNPALPQDEILSRILFNKDSSKITPFQAIQLAQMIQRFSGKGSSNGFDSLGKLRAATGLDDISVDTDASGETNVGVGKYLSDKVYLEVEKGKAANSGNATVQIEVSPQINIQSKIGQDSQTGGGIFWKHDY